MGSREPALARLIIAPVLPNPGDAEWLAIDARDRVATASTVLLIKGIHRRDQPSFPERIAKQLLLVDGLGTRMDRPEVRPAIGVGGGRAPFEVALIRDLYGTVMNEGANRGIIVTTSSYGPDAYEFAKHKPLSLVDGQRLIAMLRKHGRNYRINLAEARQALEAEARSATVAAGLRA
jgi:hypothetical protein